MAEKEKVFVDGMIFKTRENQPDFIVGSLSVKAAEFPAFLAKHSKNGWLNLDIKKSRDGKHYIEVNAWEPAQGGTGNIPRPTSPPAKPLPESDNLPF
jgi:hypothetical protein